MKRIRLSALLLTMLAGCVHSSVEEDALIESTPILHAEIADESASRTYLEQAKYMRWHADDEISAFLGNTLNQRYGFDGKTGANSGTFSQVSYQLGTGNPIEEIRAFYPYAASTSFDDISGKVNYIFPKLQAYGEGDTYGKGANPMVATTSSTSDTYLYFRNICGFLKLQLYGDDVTVKAILVKGNQAEKLSGPSVITADYNTDPRVAMTDEATEGVVLDCGEGVVLSEDASNPTFFWIAIPPTTFEGGFTITIKGDNGKGHIQSTSKQRIITRNEYLQMPAFAVVCDQEINEEDFEEQASVEEQVMIPNNQIWYTTISGLPIDVTNSGACKPAVVFGANIVSHGPQGDKIVITFDGDVTHVGGAGRSETGVFGTAVTSVVLPNSVKVIKDSAFYGNTLLKQIALPNNLQSIQSSAFMNCSSLTSMTLPESVAVIEARAFQGCSSLTTFKGKFASSDGRYLVDQGRLLAFAPARLESYTIPNTVTELGSAAFAGCSLLKTVVIPNSVTTIWDCVFEDCSSLATISIPSSVTALWSGAFRNCTALTSMILPETTRLAKSNQFENCSMLVSLKLHTQEDLQIDESMVKGCTSLTAITIHGNGRSFNFYRANVNNPSLMVLRYTSETPSGSFTGDLPDACYIYVPASAVAAYQTAWPDYADRIKADDAIPAYNMIWYTATVQVTPKYAVDANCNLLNNAFNPATLKGVMTFDGEVTTIGKYAFQSRNKLTGIKLPNSVISIGKEAFSNCTKLNEIQLPAGLTTIGERAFRNCSSLTMITIPTGVKNIEESDFWACRALQSVIFPAEVEVIGIRAFGRCDALQRISIPASVKEIGEYAFWYCSNMTEVYCQATTPPIARVDNATDTWDAFSITDGFVIYVPASDDDSIINTYKAADGWQKYADRIQEYDFSAE